MLNEKIRIILYVLILVFVLIIAFLKSSYPDMTIVDKPAMAIFFVLGLTWFDQIIFDARRGVVSMVGSPDIYKTKTPKLFYFTATMYALFSVTLSVFMVKLLFS